MAEKIMDLLKFAIRQKEAVYRVSRLASSLFTNGFSIKKLTAVVIAFFEMFTSVIFDGGLTPLGQELNLDGYTRVFVDEFDGTELNTDIWEYRASGERRGGFNAPSQVKVENGKLVITGEYLENGEYGAGWYVGMIKLKKQYCKGYFECKCICNSGRDFWSAFWIQANDPYTHEVSRGGIGGAEIDIMESLSSEDSIFQRGCITNTVHCNGGDDIVDEIDSCCIGRFRGNNIYEEYNTFGLEWTDDEYIFYINGVETGRTSWAKGVSEEAEDIIVSLEIPNEISYSEKSGHKTQFIVESVSIWEKTDSVAAVR